MLLINVFDVKIDPHLDELPFFYYLFLDLYYNIIDLVAIAQISIFYFIYSCMKHLKLMLMSSDHRLCFVLFRYKAIVDTYEKIRPLSDSLVSNIDLIALITHKYISPYSKRISTYEKQVFKSPIWFHKYIFKEFLRCFSNKKFNIIQFFKFQMVLGLFFGVPKILGTLWFVVYYIKTEVSI